MDEWLTLDSAARQLGVSVRTLRRWIKSGKLNARLEPGPYGRQYLVPRSGIDSVHLVRDVERAERQEQIETIPELVENYLARREDSLATALTGLQEISRRMEEREEAILAELRSIRQELAAIRESLPAVRTDG